MRARALEPPTHTSLEAARALLELAMPIAVQSQPSGLVFGLLSLAANQTKPLSDAAFSRLSSPGACRGITIKLRSGGDRGVGWPSLGDDQAAILLILGAMAP